MYLAQNFILTLTLHSCRKLFHSSVVHLIASLLKLWSHGEVLERTSMIYWSGSAYIILTKRKAIAMDCLLVLYSIIIKSTKAVGILFWSFWNLPTATKKLQVSVMHYHARCEHTKIPDTVPSYTVSRWHLLNTSHFHFVLCNELGLFKWHLCHHC